MTGKLFAFVLAKPIDYYSQESLYKEYDAQTQTSGWQDDGTSQALTAYCTNVGGGGYWYCHQLGQCSTWGPVCTGQSPSYFCDPI